MAGLVADNFELLNIKLIILIVLLNGETSYLGIIYHLNELFSGSYNYTCRILITRSCLHVKSVATHIHHIT